MCAGPRVNRHGQQPIWIAAWQERARAERVLVTALLLLSLILIFQGLAGAASQLPALVRDGYLVFTVLFIAGTRWRNSLCQCADFVGAIMMISSGFRS